MPAGTNVASGVLISPGGQQGIPGPNAISSDAGNQATFGSDNKIYVPDPTPVITSVRLRSFNAMGNPTFEVDQRNVGTALLNVGAPFSLDRWQIARSGTPMGINTQQAGLGTGVGGDALVPGTNYRISQSALRISVNIAQASMGAGDYLFLQQYVEGIYFRELMNDVHSLQLLVRPSVAGLRFGVALNDPGTTSKSLTKLSPALAANVWTLVQFPNLPAWPSGGSFTSAPGVVGYLLRIMLACGSSYMSPANDTWQNGNFMGAPGMSNFAATLNATFDIAFVQHEPGPLCTTLIDKPFAQNLDECQRYYAKSASYAVKPVQGGQSFLGIFLLGTTAVRVGIRFPKRMAVTPSIQTCGLTAATNAVYLDASAAAAFVQSYVSNETEVNSISLTAAGPATGGLSVLGEWAADTGC
jgi:hypothetical protein